MNRQILEDSREKNDLTIVSIPGTVHHHGDRRDGGAEGARESGAVQSVGARTAQTEHAAGGGSRRIHRRLQAGRDKEKLHPQGLLPPHPADGVHHRRHVDLHVRVSILY